MKTIDQFKPGEYLMTGCKFLGFLVDNEGEKCRVVVRNTYRIPGTLISKEMIDVMTFDEANGHIKAEAEYARVQMRAQQLKEANK